MSNKISEQKHYSKTSYHNTITNPLKIGIGEFGAVKKVKNNRALLDKAMFIALGAIAVWAFYTALASLML